jgi:hypothetical protein
VCGRVDESRGPFVLVLVVVLMVAPKLFIKLGAKAIFPALERERPQIVNNFAPSASPGYELSSSSAG